MTPTSSRPVALADLHRAAQMGAFDFLSRSALQVFFAFAALPCKPGRDPVAYPDLICAELGVSPATFRRGCVELQAHGLLPERRRRRVGVVVRLGWLVIAPLVARGCAVSRRVRAGAGRFSARVRAGQSAVSRWSASAFGCAHAERSISDQKDISSGSDVPVMAARVERSSVAARMAALGLPKRW